MSGWLPWSGCSLVSEGCRNCRNGCDFPVKTADWNLPLRRARDGKYLLKNDGDFVYTCFTSDFLHPAADAWRKEAWRCMRERKDLDFLFTTRRIHRFYASLPFDWQDGYANVFIGCCCENERSAAARLPVFFEAPIQNRYLFFQPLLEEIKIEPYLEKYGSESIRGIICSGETGRNARVCDYDWILSLRDACETHHIAFRFRQTGSLFRKNGKIYRLSPTLQRAQAAKANIDLFY